MSAITPSNINGNFPVFGQDNSTQGFRDNFTNIKSNFVFAKNEIEDLQNKAILKSALVGGALNNDLQGAVLENPQLKAYTEAYFDVGNNAGAVVIDFSQGNFQKISTYNNLDITKFSNWPATSGGGIVGYARLRLWIVVNASFDPAQNKFIPHTVRLSERKSDNSGYKVNIGINDIANVRLQDNTLFFDTPGDYVLDFSSADGGENYLIFDNTRNRVRFRDPSFYFNPDVAPTLLIGFGDIIDLAVRIARTSDTVEINGSMSSYGGVLEHGNNPGIGVYNVANINENLAGNANAAGYSVTTSRGFFDTQTNQFSTDQRALVKSDDYIGYFNFIGLSLDPTTFPMALDGAFTDFAALRSFAVGSFGNIVPGGNLVLMTKKDGITSDPFTGYLHPALSLENDQAAHFYGPAVTHSAEVSSGYQYVDLDTTTEYAIPPTAPIVLLASGTYATIPQANVMMPTGYSIKDGTKITIAAQTTITSINFINSIDVTFLNEVTIPAPQPGFPSTTILTTTAHPLLQKGLAIVTIPNYVSGHLVTRVIDNDYLNMYSSTANLVITAPADVPGTPGVTSLTMYGSVVSIAPVTLNLAESWTWLYRSADNTWYKI